MTLQVHVGLDKFYCITVYESQQNLFLYTLSLYMYNKTVLGENVMEWNNNVLCR